MTRAIASVLASYRRHGLPSLPLEHAVVTLGTHVHRMLAISVGAEEPDFPDTTYGEPSAQETAP